MSDEGRSGPGLAGSRVLVAEDDALIATELQDLLSEEGAEILGPVPTVRSAMAAIGAERPDAAVLDVNLRDASSAPVADALRAAGVPVVLVTGYPPHLLDDPSLRDAPILSKPISPRELLEVLGSLLSERPQRA